MLFHSYLVIINITEVYKRINQKYKNVKRGEKIWKIWKLWNIYKPSLKILKKIRRVCLKMSTRCCTLISQQILLILKVLFREVFFFGSRKADFIPWRIEYKSGQIDSFVVVFLPLEQMARTPPSLPLWGNSFNP